MMMGGPRERKERALDGRTPGADLVWNGTAREAVSARRKKFRRGDKSALVIDLTADISPLSATFYILLFSEPLGREN